MQKTAPYLAGLGFATIFGFSFMFTRGALAYIAPFHLLGLRFIVAVLVLAALRLLRVIRLTVSWSDYRELLPLALFQPILYFSAETTGVQLTSSSQAGMMIAIIPIIVTILARVVLKERPKPLQYPFILASVGGVVFIMAMQNQSMDTGSLGSLLLLGAVVAGACYNIASRKASEQHSPLKITWIMMVTGALVFNTIALLQNLGGVHQYFQPLTQVWPAVLYLGALSSVTAFFLINFSLSQLTATQSSVFANLTTIISIIAGVVFLKEPFYWYHGVGAAAILGGIWGTNRFARAAKVREQKCA